MFKDECLMWKIIALAFCFKRKHTKSNLLHIYQYTETYVQIHMHIAMHTRVYT